MIHPDERFMVMAYESQDDVDNKEGFFLGGEGYYSNALTIKQENENIYHLVKIFDSGLEEVDF